MNAMIKPFVGTCTTFLCATSLVLPDVVHANTYRNLWTISDSQAVADLLLIGHGSATDGGDQANSVVTILSGGTLTTAANVQLGNVAGTHRILIESGGTLDTSASGTYLYVGYSGGGYAVVTNRGTVKASYIYLGNQNYSSTSLFDNFGDVMVSTGLSLGERKGGAQAVFNNHAGATLTVSRTGEWGFYVGSRCPGLLSSDGDIILSGDLRIGGVNSAEGTGTLIMNKSGILKSGTNVRIARNASTGSLILNDSSRLIPLSSGIAMRLGEGTGSTGIFEMNDESLASINIVRAGYGTSSAGRFEMCGNAQASIEDAILAGYASNSTAVVMLKDCSCLTVTNGINLSASAKDTTAYLTLSNSALLVCTNISVATSKTQGQLGVIEVADSAVISNVVISLGASSTGRSSLGLMKMRGGKVLFNSDLASVNRPFMLGTTGDYASGVVRGWGTLAILNPEETLVDSNLTFSGEPRTANTAHLGQIIADGEGTARDLDVGRFSVYGYNGGTPNVCGTNGWFAVNKGRLKMPRSIPRKTNKHDSIGDYSVDRYRLANTFKYAFDTTAMNITGTYVWSELYATDRDDIPANMPNGRGSKPMSVWRIGYFTSADGPAVDEPSHPQAFTSVTLNFRYSPSDLEDGMTSVVVYRHDGTAGGSWRRVGTAEPSAASPLITASTISASEATWNIGWFAIVGRSPTGSMFLIR